MIPKIHADSLLTRLEDAPADTPAQFAEKAALRSQFTSNLIPTDFVQDLRADRDAMMQNLYRRHPAKLHAWLAAPHVERSPQRNKDAGTPTVGIPLAA